MLAMGLSSTQRRWYVTDSQSNNCIYKYTNTDAAGFLIPLSGGLDSASTATLVFSMSLEICKALEEGNEQVKADVQRIAGAYEKEGWLPKTPQELTGRLL
jgi:NH3-dependent NAD+ synthetase